VAGILPGTVPNLGKGECWTLGIGRADAESVQVVPAVSISYVVYEHSKRKYVILNHINFFSPLTSEFRLDV
jgi:hypothetical protein